MSFPKRKRFRRNQRLQAAKKWIPTYKGKNLVKGYSKWFGVNKICAIKELEMLNQDIDPEYKAQIIKQHKKRSETGQKRRKDEECQSFESFQNEDFYFIAGYTSGGVPYGLTWEQYEEESNGENNHKNDATKAFDDEEIPF